MWSVTTGSSYTMSSYKPPDCSDIAEYLPWAARTLCLEVDVVVKKNQLSEYHGQAPDSELQVDENDKKLTSRSGTASRKALEAKKTTDTKKALITKSLFAPNIKVLKKALPLVSSSPKQKPREECIVYLEALYDREDSLAHLVFESVPKNVNSASVLKLIALLAPQMKNLQRVSFKTGLNAAMIYEMKNFLTVSNVSEVILDYNFVPEANFHLILESKSQLRYLSLAGCALGDDTLERLLKPLRYPNNAWQSFLTLNLSSNMITDVGAGYIAEILRSNIGLYSLNLSSNQITDEGASMIFDALKEFPLTSDEIISMRTEKMEYAKLQMTHEKENINPISLQKANSPSDKKKKSKSAQTLKSAAKSPKSSHKVSKASIAFNHPFGKDRGQTFVQDQYIYHYGNFNLKLLHLNFNGLTNWSARKLLKVLLYQRMKGINGPVGLMDVTLEGNFIIACEELNMIQFILTHKYFNNAQGKLAIATKSAIRKGRQHMKKTEVSQGRN